MIRPHNELRAIEYVSDGKRPLPICSRNPCRTTYVLSAKLSHCYLLAVLVIAVLFLVDTFDWRGQ